MGGLVAVATPAATVTQNVASTSENGIPTERGPQLVLLESDAFSLYRKIKENFNMHRFVDVNDKPFEKKHFDTIINIIALASRLDTLVLPNNDKIMFTDGTSGMGYMYGMNQINKILNNQEHYDHNGHLETKWRDKIVDIQRSMYKSYGKLFDRVIKLKKSLEDRRKNLLQKDFGE